MNNQISILDRNDQSMSVELLCYFSYGSKKYIFYTKNETVQDGLIKMYVAEENAGLSNDITPDDWNNLKKIMQGIITGGTIDIQFLSYNNPLKLNDSKAIALNEANINAIKTAYKNNVGTSEGTVLNKDLLSQSFGSNVEPPKENTIETPEPVQISDIPQVQNTFNMEATPVNLNTEVSEQTNANPFDSIPKIEPIESTPMDTPNLNTLPSEPALNINSIKPSGIESGFRVSNEPNIFDQPSAFSITEEEVNTPLNDVITPVVETTDINNTNLFNQESDREIKLDNNVQVNNIDVNKQVALNERKIKLFEELANIYKEENELLKSDNALEHTASNLFNNNGTLNEREVLGE